MENCKWLDCCSSVTRLMNEEVTARIYTKIYRSKVSSDWRLMRDGFQIEVENDAFLSRLPLNTFIIKQTVVTETFNVSRCVIINLYIFQHECCDVNTHNIQVHLNWSYSLQWRHVSLINYHHELNWIFKFLNSRLLYHVKLSASEVNERVFCRPGVNKRILWWFPCFAVSPFPPSGSFSNDIFGRCTPTGSGFFVPFGRELEHILGQIVSVRVKTLSNTNLTKFVSVKA